MTQSIEHSPVVVTITPDMAEEIDRLADTLDYAEARYSVLGKVVDEVVVVEPEQPLTEEERMELRLAELREEEDATYHKGAKVN